MSNDMVVLLGRTVFADEAEKIEDALVKTLHEMRVDATVIDNVTGNTTTTDSYAERITKDDEIMYDITIDLFAGEHGYHEHIYYYGSFDAARRYANAHLSVIWGEGKETVYDELEDFYTSKDLERSAQLCSIDAFSEVVAMTAKGTLPFKASWRLG